MLRESELWVLVLNRLEALGARKIEAVEGAFAQGFVCGYFAEAGGHFEALAGEAGGEVDFALVVQVADQRLPVRGEEVRKGIRADNVGVQPWEELGDRLHGFRDFRGC